MWALARDFQAAFRNVWVSVGIVISAVALFEFGARTFSLPSGDLVEAATASYRAIFHPVVEALFSWLPVVLTPALKDTAVIYLAAGGATARTFVALTEKIEEGDVHADPLLDPFVGATLRRIVGALVGGLAWPLVAVVLWSRPIVVRFQPALYAGTRRTGWWRRRRMLRREPAAYMARARANKTFDHDLRAVFILQVLAVFAVVAGMAALAVFER